MVIERTFEVITAISPEDVYEILSDLELHIPLWSIYESMNVINDEEADVDVRISGSPYKLRIKLIKHEGRAGKSITVEGRGQIYFMLRITIEPRGMGSLIAGRVVVKGGFFRERILSPGIVAFIDDLKNKLMFQLPSIVEVLRQRRLAKAPPAVTIKASEKAAEKVPAQAKPREEEISRKPALKTPTEPKPTPTKAKAKEVEVKSPKEIKEKTVTKVEGLEVAEDPKALSDEVTLGMILLKSELVETLKIEADKDTIFRTLINLCKSYGTSEPLYVNIRIKDKFNLKFLLRGGKLIGVRIDLPEGGSLNGKEALKKMEELGEGECRVYVFKVAPEALNMLP